MGFDRWPQRLSQALGQRWIIVLAMVLSASSLFGGLAWDDYYLATFIKGGALISPRAPWDLFSFVRTPVHFQELADVGILPWFTNPDLHMAFFRPLSSLWHYLDFQLFPGAPWLMHLENVLLYGALLAVVALLYRRFLVQTPLVLLALFLYAIDDAHGVPVGWISNRNSLLASIFGILALIGHDQWRARGDKRAALLAFVSFAIGLLSAEFGLGILAYLGAYALILDKAPRVRALACLLPYGLIVAIWGAGYHHLGYGAGGAGYYIDPVSHTSAYLSHFPQRLFTLLAAQLAFPSADFWVGLSTGAKAGLMLLRLAMITVVTWAAWPFLRRDKTLQFFALGLVVAIIPIASTLASDRVLLLIGLGAFPLIASIFQQDAAARFGATPSFSRSAFIGLRRVLILTHVIYAAIVLPLNSLAMTFVHGYVNKMAESPVLGPELSQQTLVLVTTPGSMVTNYRWAIAPEGKVAAQRVRALATTSKAVSVSREDARTLLVTAEDGLVDDVYAILFREEGHDPQGDIRTEGVSYRVERVDAQGRATVLRATFDRDLESSEYRWLAWQQDHYEAFVLPQIGKTVQVGLKSEALK